MSFAYACRKIFQITADRGSAPCHKVLSPIHKGWLQRCRTECSKEGSLGGIPANSGAYAAAKPRSYAAVRLQPCKCILPQRFCLQPPEPIVSTLWPWLLISPLQSGQTHFMQPRPGLARQRWQANCHLNEAVFCAPVCTDPAAVAWHHQALLLRHGPANRPLGPAHCPAHRALVPCQSQQHLTPSLHKMVHDWGLYGATVDDVLTMDSTSHNRPQHSRSCAVFAVSSAAPAAQAPGSAPHC